MLLSVVQVTYLDELYGECSWTAHTCTNSRYQVLLSDFGQVPRNEATMKSKSCHCYILCCHLSLIYWLHMPHRYHSYTHSTLKSQSLKAQGAAIGDANLCRQRRRGPSLLMAVAKTIWKPMVVSAVLKLAQDLLGFVSPQILRFVDHANLESRWSIQYKLCR